jgi:hypothetical protein
LGLGSPWPPCGDAPRGSLRQGSAFTFGAPSLLRQHSFNTNHLYTFNIPHNFLIGELHLFLASLLPSNTTPLQRCEPGKRSDRAPATRNPISSSRRYSPTATQTTDPTPFATRRSLHAFHRRSFLFFGSPEHLHNTSSVSTSYTLSYPLSSKCRHVARQKGPSRDPWLSYWTCGPWENPCVH